MNKIKGKYSFDSPYKDCLSEIKCVDTNNEDDNFATPKVTKKIPKTIKKQVKKKPKCKSQRIDTIFRKANDTIHNFDVNPDHIQMAIALSKSTLDQENPEESKRLNVEDSSLTFGHNYDQKLGNILEKYGFRSTRSGCNSGTILNQEKASQKRKYPRFRYALLSTTKEDRDALVEKKISAIMCQFHTNFENGKTECNIFSDMLKDYHVKHSKLLKVHSFDNNEDVSNYYTMNLNLPRSHSSCGSLLKDWKDIPGRELSPIPGELREDSLSENFCSSKSGLGLENTYSSESLGGTSTCTSRKNNLESEQTSSYDSHKENDYSKNIEMNLVGNTEPKQVETLYGDSPKSFNISRSNTLARVTETKELKSSYFHKPNICIEGTKSIILTEKCDQTFSNKPKLSESIIQEENTKSSEPRTYCISPDLFSSDDDGDFVTLEKHSKFQASPETNGDQKGIECFESFSADSCALSQEMYKSSNPETNDSISHEMAGVDPINDDQNQSDQVIVVLDSDEDSAIVANEENKESERIKNDMEVTSSCLTLANTDKISQPQNSKISLSTINDEDDIKSDLKKELPNENILEHDYKRSTFYTNDSESYAELKLTPPALDSEYSEIKNSDNIENKEMDIKDHYHEREQQRSVADMDYDAPRCSSSSKLYSPSFNSNSKLNVTDYIENMLSEDFITGNDVDDRQNDKEISLSQSSSESIVISDEELNCTKIQHGMTDACCDYDELDDKHASSGEETEEAEDVITENDNKSSYGPQKRSVTFNDSFDRLLQNSEILDGLNNLACEPITNRPSHSESEAVQKENGANQNTVPVTPKNKLIIKTRDVTPMPEYERMSSAEIVEELKKFRVKPLKRQRGITMLKYIYECTHPMIPTNEEYRDEEEENRIFKKRRKDKSSGGNNLDNVTKMKCMDVVCKNEIIECENPEDLIFERKFRAKLAYCRIPLQIVWYNFVQSNPELKKNILLYEPLHLNSVYAMLKEQSNCKFHIEDFITFLDKKSITFRTS